MAEQIFIISMIVTAMHVCTWEGMIFHNIAEGVGEFLDAIKLSVLRKPLFECLICMGGVWTCFWYPILYELNWHLIPVAIGVIGLNTIVSLLICKLHE